MLSQLDSAIMAKNVLTSLKQIADTAKKFTATHSNKLQQEYSETIFVNYYKDRDKFTIIVTVLGEKLPLFRFSFDTTENLRAKVDNEIVKVDEQLKILSDMRKINNTESGAKELVETFQTQIKDFLANAEIAPNGLNNLTPYLNKLNAVLFAIEYK